MTAPRSFIARLIGTVTRRRSDARLQEEIQAHLQGLTEEFIAAGLAPAAARARARREFGNVEAIKESTRDEFSWPALQSLVQDVRFALRQLRRSPSFTITAILTLAIGIGGTSAIFSVIDTVMLRPLPYSHSERLVTLQETLPTFGPFPVSAADADYWREHTSSFEAIALVSGRALNITGAGEPERLITGTVTPNFFRILGATTQLGRLPIDDEDQPGRDLVVVLNDNLWRRRFNADPAIVGRTVQLNGVAHEVIGVLSRDFSAPNTKLLHSLPTREVTPDLWKPLALARTEKPAIGGYSLACVALLKPGVTAAQARQDLAAAQSRLVASIPNKGRLETVLTPMQEQMASRTRAGLTLLLVAVAAVLLIGSANIVSLLLSRTLARRTELSVRTAVGAGPRRIARQLVVENLVLGVLGGGVGILVALAVLRVIVATAPAEVPMIDEVAIDGRVLAFAAGLSLVCGLLIGLAPAWRYRNAELRSALNGRGPQHVSLRVRSVLVVGEIGLGAAAVAVAILLLQSFAAIVGVERGFTTERVLTTDLNLAGPRYEKSQQQALFVDAVAEDLRREAEVATVAVSTQLPLTGTGALSALSVEGTTAPATERPSADVRSVSSEYFKTLALPARSGRLFEAADRDRNVAVVSEQLARRGWPGQDPVGRRFRFGVNPQATLYEVIGTVADLRGTSLDQPMTPTAYVPYPQRSQGGVSLIVKTTADPNRVAATVRRALRQHDPQLPLLATRTMEDVVDDSLAGRRFQLRLVSIFALLAALLAGVGVYGVMTSSVTQRANEIGVRLALGARPAGVLGLVLREALVLSVGGLVVAAAIGLAGSSFLRSLLFNVTPFDPGALAITAAAVLGTAILAAAAPALRASRVDPMTALRND